MSEEPVSFWNKEIKKVAIAIVPTYQGQCEVTFFSIAGDGLYPVVGKVIPPKKRTYKEFAKSGK